MAPAALKKLVASQTTRFNEIKQSYSRIKDRRRDTLSVSVLQSRIDALNDLWVEARQADSEILARDGIENESYVTNGVYANMLDAYEEAIEQLVTLREELQPASQPTHRRPRARSESESGDDSSRQAKLPRIDLPKFAGEPEEWESFCDSFTTLVHKARGLSDSTKLQYLKSCLNGEAADWIKNVSVTNANYASTWRGLKERFFNPRVTVNNHLDALLNLPHLTKESAVDLRSLASTAQRTIAALENLHVPVQQWDIILIHLLRSRLDPESRKLWEAELSKRDRLAVARARTDEGETDALARFSTIHEFIDFLVMRSDSLKAAANKPDPASKTHSNSRKIFHAQSTATENKRPQKCPLCVDTHPMSRCPQFLAKSPNERRFITRKHQRCFNCLGPHRFKACPSNGRCHKCQGQHHTLIHFDQGTSQGRDIVTKQESRDQTGKPTTSVAVHTASIATSSVSVILATAQVNVCGPRGAYTRARALLDQGSETTFISELLAQLLELPRKRTRIALNGVGGSEVGTARATATFTLRSRLNPDVTIVTEALVLPRLTSELPSRDLMEIDLSCFSELPLADPEFHHPAAIDIILGADLYGQLLRAGVRSFPSTRLIAQNTVLGWIVSGAVADVPSRRAERGSPGPVKALHSRVEDDMLDDSLQRFWKLEEVPQATSLKPEDEACEKLFAETHKRDATGRYIVRLPVKGQLPQVAAETRNMALGSLRHMHRRFSRNSVLAEQYTDFMTAYQDLGHMSPVPPEDLDNPHAWYLPHHAVTQTSKLRVVFDASRQTRERQCLNDFLLPGPPLQRDLLLVLLNWCQYPFGFTADIVKMFRHIGIALEDRNLQRILWSPSPDIDPIDHYLNTVTYGTASAPYLALRTLLQLARDERSRFPLGAQCLEDETYVDDSFVGDDELSGAIRKRDELIGILGTAGIELNKWAANHPDLIPPNEKQTEGAPLKEIDRENSVKTLGIQWSPSADEFRFSAPKIDSASTSPTKRVVLSNIARLFDPLGWLSPVTVVAKILMQDLWILKCDWDSPLPSEATERWQNYCDSLSSLPDLAVKRWLGTRAGMTLEIHGFSDASARAYAAAVYLRIQQADGQYRATLLAAKTKVSPVKTVSIPNLELCGAFLLVKLVCHLRTLKFLQSAPIHLWSDSEIVLRWLNKHPCHWKTFVANRVSQIQTELPSARWSHVSTKENPADIATRGSTPTDLRDSDLWWHGPSWLSLPSENWPQPRHNAKLLHARADTSEPYVLRCFSSLNKVIRVLARCRRWLADFRRRKSGLEPLSPEYTPLELAESRKRLIAIAQAHAFATELSLL